LVFFDISYPPCVLKIADIQYAKFFLATSEYREVARLIFQNVAPKFFSLVCSDPETTRLLESGTSAINQQVSAKNEKTGCDIVRIIEGGTITHSARRRKD